MLEDLTKRLEHINSELQKRTRMNLCLPETDVRAFEQRWNVQLPEGYRQFLLTAGNGGVGPPDYGLLPLGEVPDDYDRSAAEVLHDLCQPFPLQEAWVWEGEDEEKPHLRRAIYYGNLILGTNGCGQYWLLIVTGPERGRIWMRADVGITPCDPPRDFLSWYEYWLAGGKDWWAGYGS